MNFAMDNPGPSFSDRATLYGKATGDAGAPAFALVAEFSIRAWSSLIGQPRKTSQGMETLISIGVSEGLKHRRSSVASL